MENKSLVWIKGAGDIASAIGHRLLLAGFAPILAEVPAPVIARRRMAFGGALHDGEASLEGVRGVRCTEIREALILLEQPQCIPVLEWEHERVAEEISPRAAVDARMRKRIEPPVQLGEAPLVIGVGPGFETGKQVHLAVESNWGERLGMVIREGAATAYTGEPRSVEGVSRERYLYAPHPGTFRTEHDVTDMVEAGETAGWVDQTPLRVTVSGVLRGLAHDGVRVKERAKLVEVDPRGDPKYCIGIAERPARIAEGVLSAIREWMEHPAPGR